VFIHRLMAPDLTFTAPLWLFYDRILISQKFHQKVQYVHSIDTSVRCIVGVIIQTVPNECCILLIVFNYVGTYTVYVWC